MLKGASTDGTGVFDIDDLDERLAGFEFNDSDDDEENDAEEGEGGEKEEAQAASDSIGMALLLVKQVCFSCRVFKNIYIYS